jgi:hypothetical protein
MHESSHFLDKFGLIMNGNLDGYSIPEAVTTLSFGGDFNQELKPDVINYNNTIILEISNKEYSHDRYQVTVLGKGDKFWKYDNGRYLSVNSDNIGMMVNKLIYDVTFRRAHQQGHELIGRLPHDMINLIGEFINQHGSDQDQENVNI